MPSRAESTTKLCPWGTSRAVRIPKPFCDDIGIGVGSSLRMRVVEDSSGTYLVIRPENSGHRSFAHAPFLAMDDMFAGYTGEHQPTEADWGADLGAEVIQ
ncbi:MAG: AbrB/MazE/SpoVT family DNA-binding domain-containing protein [Coriobacteriales bacterium]|jgi:antitoxin MazE|nr:AbrB/MazE/SpoVT family DNA-binding domain-containing protein [Coriobacteriales bacterium]